MLTAYTIKTDGSIEAKQLSTRMSLKEKQAVVGGLIQIVPEWDRYADKPAIVFANEEGVLEGLPYNHAATDLWTKHLFANFKPEDLNMGMVNLVGDVLVITGDTAEEVEDC